MRILEEVQKGLDKKQQRRLVAVVDKVTGQREYVQLKTLRQLYDLGRTAAYALVKQMEASKFHAGVLRLSQNLVLVNLKQWEAFLLSIDRLYLRQ